MKSFQIPEYYKSPLIAEIKEKRKREDPRKQDFAPSFVDFGNVRFYLARHFGFCYGVENAIEIAYKALHENEGKRIYLLSQMIHNPEVNADLEANGIKFIMDTEGNHFVQWDELKPDDVVVIPAFGTTLEIEKLLADKGIQTEKYNTTCPFVEKVWNRAQKLGSDKYTILIHGKAKHEETRATFSHSNKYSHSVVLRDMEEAKSLAQYINGEKPSSQFYEEFKGRYSEGFNVEKDLTKVGVINQTTMLATETQAIADFFKQTMAVKYGQADLKNHFADTRDTLCYATNDNQEATLALMNVEADMAIVVGGYNSSNTSHLVELLEQKFKTYFIKNETEIGDDNSINHFDYPNKKMLHTNNFIGEKRPFTIILTSGASCPDAVMERVMLKLKAKFE
ncbi:MAG TPA: 4-hydroxy-3-methylbut-2-enyl diphosphate reductase [Flavobacteriales bacterium]|nr:4-hydroxy-3-methylbut-2-enyl diphosphate reductase [Flavobacteriales bacterium]